MELSNPKIKKVLIFSLKKKAFLMFWEMELSKKTSYISGKNFLSLQIKGPTLKKFLVFHEMEISSPKLKKLLYFF